MAVDVNKKRNESIQDHFEGCFESRALEKVWPITPAFMLKYSWGSRVQCVPIRRITQKQKGPQKCIFGSFHLLFFSASLVVHPPKFPSAALPVQRPEYNRLFLQWHRPEGV